MTVNSHIKSLIDELGLTQTEFGDRLGMTPMTISLIVKGKRRVYADEVVKIAKEFKVDPLSILWGTSTKHPMRPQALGD